MKVNRKVPQFIALIFRFDYFLDINKFPTTLHYEYDEESSELCNELYEKLETTPSLKIVWRIMKPFVK